MARTVCLSCPEAILVSPHAACVRETEKEHKNADSFHRFQGKISALDLRPIKAYAPRYAELPEAQIVKRASMGLG